MIALLHYLGWPGQAGHTGSMRLVELAFPALRQMDERARQNAPRARAG